MMTRRAYATNWNWGGKGGQPIKVVTVTKADRGAALSLDCKLIDEIPVDPSQVVGLQLPDASGQLEAVAKKGGHEIARHLVETTDEPVKLRLAPDRGTLACDGCEALLVAVEALGAHGRPVLTANFGVAFEILGPGRIFGVGNGDPHSHDPEKGNRRSLFNGLVNIIVQATKDVGEIKLTATADGLSPATTVLKTAPTQPIQAIL